MSDVAVLGLGAMGSRMAANLLKAGHRVSVWNRTPAAAEALVREGARQGKTPREAAAGAEFVIAMVRDDEASRQVWLDPDTGALAGLAPSAVAIESSTLSLSWVRELAEIADARGIDLIEAPVSGSLPQAQSAQLIYFIGGDKALFHRAEPVLKSLGSAFHIVGPLGAGAQAKLATNALMGAQVTALAELIGLLKRDGADVARVLEAVAATSAWSPAAARASQSMLAGAFAPNFPVDLIEKDFGYVIEAAEDRAPTLSAAREVFRDAKDHGFGGQHMTAVAQLFAQ